MGREIDWGQTFANMGVDFLFSLFLNGKSGDNYADPVTGKNIEIPAGKTLADIDPETARFYNALGDTKLTGEMDSAIGDIYMQYMDIPEGVVSRTDFKGLETAYRNYEANNTVANAAAFIDEAKRVYTLAGESGYRISNPYDTMNTAIEADYAVRQGKVADIGRSATDIGATATDIGATATDIGGSATDIGATARGNVDTADGAVDNGNRSETRNKANLDQDTVDRILSIPKGKRPDPSTYFDQDHIDAHLSEFYEGVAKIKANPPKDVEGVGLGTFVMPKSIADEAIAIARGDIRLLEKLLALKPGSLGDNPIRLDIPNPKNLRLPSGNEAGAFPGYWIPGGYTKGGIIEAVIDPVLPGEYIVTPLT